jgi:hypothetical protein
VEILNSGLIESEDHLVELTHGYRQLVIPNENDDLDLTHWWVIKEEGTEILYVGTPETFTTYVKERNGGIRRCQYNCVNIVLRYCTFKIKFLSFPPLLWTGEAKPCAALFAAR